MWSVSCCLYVVCTGTSTESPSYSQSRCKLPCRSAQHVLGIGVLCSLLSITFLYQLYRADAGKVELDGASYLGFSLPFSITQLVWIEALLVGGAEVYRNTELNPEKRLYPGGVFDPLNLASDADPERAFRLKTAEIKHARLAMVAFLGQWLVGGCVGCLLLQELLVAASCGFVGMALHVCHALYRAVQAVGQFYAATCVL